MKKNRKVEGELIKAPRPPRYLPDDVVVLKLPYEVARTLAKVLANVGGDPRLSARGHTDQIADALEALGVEQRALAQAVGVIYFPVDTDNFPEEG